MEIVIHRVNRIQQLVTIPRNLGCEIDIRSNGNELILNHEPMQNGDLLTEYLDMYQHGLLVLNIKEAGIEDLVLAEVRKRNIQNYFLLDVEFPYLYQAADRGEKSIAIRFSEVESIETVKNFQGKLDWVWIDTNTILPINTSILTTLGQFKSCLVCPERWGRPDDIVPYCNQMKKNSFKPTAVMTTLQYAELWQEQLLS
jgi:hypothetical protein